ncbi:MAG: MFS family permease [Parasphingorhabdus sp.]
MLPLALKNPNFARYAIGSLFNTMSFWVQRLCFGWLSWQLTESEFWVGVIAFLLFFPVVIFGPFFGVMADHINRQKTAQRILFFAVFSLAALAIVTYNNLTTIWVLCFFAGVTGLITSAYSPLRMAMVPALVKQKEISSAVATTAIIFNISRLTGPALAGFMIAWFGVASALALCALLTIPLILILPRLEFRQRKVDQVTQRGLHGLTQGFKYVLRQREIILFLFLSAVISLFGRGILELLPAFADGLFEKGSIGLAMMTAAAGLGAIFAGLLLSYLSSEKLVGWSLASLGFLIVAFGMSPNFNFALVTVVLMGFSITLCGVGTQTMLQLMVEEDYRGRVMSLWGVVGFGGTAVGGLVLGIVSTSAGLPTTTIASGIACVIGSLPVLYILYRRKSV